jgi:hypothetical protein
MIKGATNQEIKLTDTPIENIIKKKNLILLMYVFISICLELTIAGKSDPVRITGMKYQISTNLTATAYRPTSMFPSSEPIIS